MKASINSFIALSNFFWATSAFSTGAARYLNRNLFSTNSISTTNRLNMIRTGGLEIREEGATPTRKFYYVLSQFD